MAEDIASPIPDGSRAYLASQLHCNGCMKLEITKGEFANFVILFWDRFDEKTGEPIVRDGVFDENGRVAVLKACPDCGPKVKALHKNYAWTLGNQLYHLNDGPLKKMLLEIWPRRKASWKLEIGWQLMLPILQKMKADKIAKSRMS